MCVNSCATYVLQVHSRWNWKAQGVSFISLSIETVQRSPQISFQRVVFQVSTGAWRMPHHFPKFPLPLNITATLFPPTLLLCGTVAIGRKTDCQGIPPPPPANLRTHFPCSTSGAPSLHSLSLLAKGASASCSDRNGTCSWHLTVIHCIFFLIRRAAALTRGQEEAL